MYEAASSLRDSTAVVLFLQERYPDVYRGTDAEIDIKKGRVPHKPAQQVLHKKQRSKSRR